MQPEETLGREIADIIKASMAGYQAGLANIEARCAALEVRQQDETAPDDVSEQVARALAIVAQPVLIPQVPLQPLPAQAAPAVVNIAMPEPRKVAKQIKMRRDADNNLIADVIETELD